MAAAGCCRLLLAAAGCCWLLLAVSWLLAGAGCWWLLLAVGCCWLLAVVGWPCRWLLLAAAGFRWLLLAQNLFSKAEQTVKVPQAALFQYNDVMTSILLASLSCLSVCLCLSFNGERLPLSLSSLSHMQEQMLSSTCQINTQSVNQVCYQSRSFSLSPMFCHWNGFGRLHKKKLK